MWFIKHFKMTPMDVNTSHPYHLYECNYCDSSYVSLSWAQKHLTKNHDDELDQYLCQSTFDENNEVQDCSCGKCEWKGEL